MAAAMRRLEMRIGELLPKEQGKRTDLLPGRDPEVPELRDDERADFRQMAAHPDVVEDVIAKSTSTSS